MTTLPHSKESRPEIWVPPERRRDTQVEDDPPFPKLLHSQNGATTKRLISKIILHIESTPFVSSIRPNVPPDVIISSFSKFNGRTILKKKQPGKGSIVFDSNIPPSSRRNPNLGTRFFWVGVSCHTLASHASEFVHHVYSFIRNLKWGSVKPSEAFWKWHK